MNIIMFAIVNIAVLISAINFSSRLKLNSFIDKILSIFILAVGQVVLTELILGVIVRRLYDKELLLLNFFILVISFFAINKGCIVIDINRFKNKVFELVKSPVLVVLSILTLFELIYIIFIGINYPPFGIDALTYHLTSVGLWYQEGRIFTLPTRGIIDGWFWSNVYPINGELLCLWNIIFLGNDVIVGLTQLPFAIIGGMGIFALCRKLDISLKNSMLANLLFLITPIVALQSCTAYVDVIFGASVILVINFIVGYYKFNIKQYIFLTGIACGFLLGVKAAAIVYVLVFGVIMLVINAVHNRNFNIKSIMHLLLMLIIPIIILGSFSYIRNMVCYNNPVYPMQVNILGVEVFKGIGDLDELVMGGNVPEEYSSGPNFINVLKTWFEKTDYYDYDIRQAGFGPIWIILGVPSIIFLIISSIKSRNKLLSGLVIVFLILFIIQPSNWWTRYTIFFLGLGYLSTAYFINQTKISNKIIYSLVLVLSIYTVISTIPYIPNKFMSSTIEQVLKMPMEARTIANVYYNDYRWCDELPKDSRIGVISSQFIYPIFSESFKNKIYIIDNYTREEINKNILQNNIQYIIILSSDLNNLKWIETSSGYEQFLKTDTQVVFKVLR